LERPTVRNSLRTRIICHWLLLIPGETKKVFNVRVLAESRQEYYPSSECRDHDLPGGPRKKKGGKNGTGGAKKFFPTETVVGALSGYKQEKQKQRG